MDNTIHTKSSSSSANFLSDNKTRELIKRCPLYLDAENEMHVLMFRKILEISLSQGRWWGEVPKVS